MGRRAPAPHLFSSRQPQLSQDVCAALARAAGAASLVTATQVHGAAVAVCRAGEPYPPASVEADIIVASGADVAIAVRSADCVPVLLADRRTGAVAAVHAGWRGTSAGASAAAVAALSREFDSRPGDLVAIGPHIGVCCYEVGTEVVDAFAAAGFERYLIDRWFPVGAPGRGSRARPPMHLDLGLANQDQLLLAGVPQEHIHHSNLCTAEHLDVLTSFRIEAAKAGRLVAAIRSGLAFD